MRLTEPAPLNIKRSTEKGFSLIALPAIRSNSIGTPVLNPVIGSGSSFTIE